jgi:hypothetical protein
MKAIYSFKKFKNSYKPLDDRFCKVAACGVKSVSQFYKTKLYTDSYGAHLFKSKGIVFDEVVISDDIEDYEGDLFCMPKLISMMEQTEPYIHFDFDTILFEKIYSPHTITYAYWDLDLSNNPKTDQLDSMIYHYHSPYKKYIRDIFDDSFEPKWLRVPNHSFFMVKNPTYVAEKFKEIIQKLPEHTLEVCDAPGLIEQFLFFQYLLVDGVDYGFVNKYATEDIINKTDGSYKLFHLFYYWVEEKKQDVNQILDILLKRFEIDESIFKKQLT